MEKKEEGKIKKKLLHKYRLVVLNEETLKNAFLFQTQSFECICIQHHFCAVADCRDHTFNCLYPIAGIHPGYSSTALKKKQPNLPTKQIPATETIGEPTIHRLHQKVLTGDVKAEPLNKDSLLESVQKEVNQQF